MKKLISALLILTMICSMVVVSASAAGTTYINMNFESMDVFTQQFTAGAFFVEDPGTLHGYAEAKALQSNYGTNDDLGVFDNTGYTWLTYDASITLTCMDDDMSETGRWLNLVYANDNLFLEGRAEGREMMSFSYDVEERCFRLAMGWDNQTPEEQLLPPVYMEIDTDGEESITMGISIERSRMRCFYNDQLIFDFNDTNDDYLIAKEINSCFLFWQDGNYVQISNIKVTDAGTMFPHANVEPPVSTEGNDPVEPGTTAGGNNDPVEPGTTAGGNNDPVDPEKPEQPNDNNNVGNNVDNGNNNAADNNQNAGNNGNNNNQNAGNTPAQTNTNKPAGGSSTATGDVTFVVVAAMVATLGCALIVRKASVR